MEIELKQAGRQFSRTTAIDSVSAKFGPGEIIAIAGLHGSGKSVLLRVLSGSIGLSSGELLFDGESFCDEKPEMERSVLFLSDPPPLLPQETVLRNISLFLAKYQKTEDPEIAEKIMSLLGRFNLAGSAETTVDSLSRDQARHVALVILAAVDPPLWLLDSPLPEFSELAREAAKRGRTVIYSTQHLDLPESIATRVCLMNHGNIYADAEPGQIRKLAETDHLVATLIGEG